MIYSVSVKAPLVTTLVISLVSISITSGFAQTIEQQILGTWQTELEGKKALFIFASENKLFIVGPSLPESSANALEFKYQINSKTQPTQLDFFYDSNAQEKALTILEITQDNSLKIQLEGLNPNQPRPTTFAPNATIFTRISNSTTLPANAVIYKPLEQIAKAYQVEAQTNVASINRSQMAYRFEKNRFATTFDQLAIGNLTGKSRAQTSNYSYKLFGRKDRAYVTAAAKTKGLKSYVGATFLYRNSQKQSVMSRIICETEKPTQTPPKFPKFVGGQDPIRCAAGSKSVE
jgi:hypothetical protein